MDIFFAISGFLICGLLFNEFAETVTSVFAASTFADAFAFCLRTMCPGRILCRGGFCALPVNFSDLPSCLLFYRNYRPLGIDQYGGFYTAHFWTLAVEEHFYLIWPMLLLAVRPKRAGKVAFLLAMMVFAWRVIEGHFHLLAVYSHRRIC